MQEIPTWMPIKREETFSSLQSLESLSQGGRVNEKCARNITKIIIILTIVQ